MDLAIDKKDELVIKLLHYFVTERNYKPIVIQGAKNEIWLENLDDEYKIVRIVSSYIHNDEQLDFDMFKTQKIAGKIKRKTLSLSVNILNIFVHLGDNVSDLESTKDMTCLNIKDISDFKNYDKVCTIFPDIDKINFREKGMNLFIKLTEEINKKTEDDAKRADDIFNIKPPLITYSLIFINVVVFIMTFIISKGTMDANTLVLFGANFGPYVSLGQYYRLISSVFLHADIIHLVLNCYALLVIGRQLESYYGKIKFLIIYFVSAIVANIFSLAFTYNYVSVGASGALFALLGSLLYFGYHYRVYLGNVLRSQVVPIILFNLLIGFFISGINVSAHIGGLIAGVLISSVVGVSGKTSKSDRINGIIMFTIFTVFSIYLAFLK